MSKSAQNLSTRVLILLLALTSIFLLMGNTGVADEPVVVSTYVVQPGDTLWSIAGGISDSGDDVRDVIAHVRHLNSLSGSSLQVGQSLVLPSS